LLTTLDISDYIAFVSRNGGTSENARIKRFHLSRLSPALFYPLRLNFIQTIPFSRNLGAKKMQNTPKYIEERYNRFVTALKTLAPGKTFAGISLEDFETQVAASNAPRTELNSIEDTKKQFIVTRDGVDSTTMQMCDAVVKAVVADPEFGDDSALYEALGYIRKSDRKSGLTRKKVEPLNK
jgi:hypothetical protein